MSFLQQRQNPREYYPNVKINKQEVVDICRSLKVCDTLTVGGNLIVEHIEFPDLPPAEDGQVITQVGGVAAWADIPAQNLAELGDVVITGPTNGDYIRYNSGTSKWVNQTIGDNLASLTDVTLTSPSNQQILTYDSGLLKWVNASLNLSALTDVNISSPVNGDTIVYDSGSSKWINVQAANTVDDLLGLELCSGFNWQKLKNDIMINNPLLQNLVEGPPTVFTDTSQFNYAFAIDGNRWMTVAPTDGPTQEGLVYVYESLNLYQIIVPPIALSNPKISISGNRMILNEGTATYLYEVDQTTELFSLVRTISGIAPLSICIVGDYYAVANTTKVVIYSATNVMYEEELLNPSPGLYNYGSTIDMSGSRLVVGAYTAGSDGLIYVYSHTNGVWALEETIAGTLSDTGLSVKLEGIQLLVMNSGGVELYTYDGSWILNDTISLAGIQSIGLSNNYLMISDSIDLKIYDLDSNLLNTLSATGTESLYAERLAVSGDILLVSSTKTTVTNILPVIHYYSASFDRTETKNLLSLNTKTRDLCWIDAGSLNSTVTSDLLQTSDVSIPQYSLTYPTFANNAIIEINQGAFKISGKYQLNVTNTTTEVFVIDLPQYFNNRQFPPLNNKVQEASVSGMFMGHFSDSTALNGIILYNDVSPSDRKFYFRSLKFTGVSLPATANITFTICGLLEAEDSA